MTRPRRALYPGEVLFPLATILTLLYATPPAPPPVRPRLDPATQQVLNRARSAPPELAADLLLRLQSRLPVLTKQDRLELIDEAYGLAGGAEAPQRLKAFRGALDRATAAVNRAHSFGLDRASLQLRATEALLPLDPAQARARFAAVQLPAAPTITCDDVLLPDHQTYWRLLPAVFRTVTEAERKQQLHAALLLGSLRQVRLATDVAPAANALTGLAVEPELLSQAALVFAQAVQSIPSDPRSLPLALPAAGEAITELLSSLRARGVDPTPVALALRDLYLRTLSGPMCADSALLLNPNSKTDSLAEVERFNGTVRESLGLEESVRPILPDDIRPGERIEPKGAAVKPSAAVTKFSEAVRGLYFGANFRPLTAAERGSAEWNQQLQTVLEAANELTPADLGGDVALYHERMGLYAFLMPLVPTAAQRDRLLADAIGYLRAGLPTQATRLDWLAEALPLIQSVTGPQADLVRSSDPVLSLYLDLK